MKKVLALGLLICFGLIGCGVKGTDASKATPPMAAEQQTSDIESAIKSGKLDPATYGKVQ